MFWKKWDSETTFRLTKIRRKERKEGKKKEKEEGEKQKKSQMEKWYIVWKQWNLILCPRAVMDLVFYFELTKNIIYSILKVQCDKVC